MIPLIQEEVVEIQGWLTQKSSSTLLLWVTVCRGRLPRRCGVRGIPGFWGGGAAAGLVGVTVPTAVAMFCSRTLPSDFARTRRLPGFSKVPDRWWLRCWRWWCGNSPPAPSARRDSGSGNWALWALALVAFVLSVRFNVHPAFLIVAGGAVGMLVLR